MRPLNQPETALLTDPICALATNLLEQSVDDRFGKDPHLGRASTSSAAAAVKIAKKYEEALKALARELACVKENERQQIAEQLHDGFGQDLVLAKMRLGQLSDRLPPRYEGCVKEIADIIGNLICHTRTVIHELSPQDLCEAGLKAALQSLAAEVQMKHGLICTAKLDSMPKLLKDETQQILFRAVRELLFNVVKHARASRVKIVMIRKPGSVVTEVCDDGRGFDRHETALGNLSIGRFGLLSVRARLAPLGGDLRIFSRVGSGTRAIITLPIDAAQ